jgi:hypothetical protein
MAMDTSQPMLRKLPIEAVIMPGRAGGSKLTERQDSISQDYFRQGVEQFNAEKFFEAHESWEAIWLHAPEPEKTFLQGITQVSAAFHHYSKGNNAGAKTLLERGLEKLAGFPADYRGLRLNKFREDAGSWLEIFARKECEPKKTKPKIQWK